MPSTDTPCNRQFTHSPDGRLDAAAFHRNFEPMLAVLHGRLAERTGHVLEIGSGTGQHIVGFARVLPSLTWWPSDPDPAHRRSVDAWRAESGAANVMPGIDLDATAPDAVLCGAVGWPDEGFTAVLSMNVIHIAPWRVCEGIMRLAGAHLAPAGLLLLYGPFKRGGAHTAPSNEAFDAMLRRENVEWGVRDLEDIETAAEREGLRLAEIVEMPANNWTVIFERQPDPPDAR